MKYPVVFFSLFLSFHVWGQDPDTGIIKLTRYIQTLNNFSKHIPQEKVYLHFDNTGYYQGDNIWFKCYIVSSGQHQLSRLSKTLYVELLNPGGEVIDKQVLKIENGQCHSNFTLNQLPFYSGFYEVRAYTKYMLNFGDDAIFSRLLPVFDKPKEEGNFEEKEMWKYGRGSYPVKREKPLKGKRVNLRFFPEGGNMIRGIASRLAFEATDEAGNPINVTGVVADETEQDLYRFTTQHEGRGMFVYTPDAGKRKVLVEYSGKKYRFDLPPGLPQGFTMKVDNLSQPDSIGICLRKNSHTPGGILGVVVLSGGKLQDYCMVDIVDDEVDFKMDKTHLPSGVSQIVLFNETGEIICDRLIFTRRNESLDIKAKIGKSSYKPYELVDMDFSVTDKASNPVQTTFSLSVKDGMNEVACRSNILTDLLLMSEIKGYVRNPSYYFETDDETHRAALDLLLMVQGWRRYLWKQMTGVESLQLKYLPEQGIEANGKVVSLVKQIPKPNVDVSCFLLQKGEENEKNANFIESFVTDSLGRFSFVSDVQGKWSMILAVTEKGKKKDHRIILDRLFSPEPKRYRYAEMQVNIAGDDNESINNEETPDDHFEEDLAAFRIAYEDSLARAGFSDKIHHLDAVTVSANKRSRERDIYNNRLTSVAYYDVHSEMDDIKDGGKYMGDNIHQLLINMNKDFYTILRGNSEYILYKQKMPLFVIDYRRTEHTEMGYTRYKLIRLNAIKSIYINEDLSVMCKYADPRMTSMDVAHIYSCAVLIETYPEGQIPVDGAKGVRKTWLEGYSRVEEFYSPDYSVLPPEPDYRRTLYWNPSVVSDEKGNVRIKFYNNSRCTKFSISAETITSQGMIGVYKNE